MVLGQGELESLIARKESDRVELKRDISNMDSIRKAVCAFANDIPNHQKPGVIIIGVEDDGQPANLDITDALLRTLSDIATDGNILPLPQLTVQKESLHGREVAIIHVEPAEAPPVRYRGSVWVRIGPRLAIASQQQEHHLAEKRRSRDMPFDLHPADHADLDDLDTDLFTRVYLPQAVSPEALAENHRSMAEQLVSLRLACNGKVFRPTNNGILVLGKEPTDHIPAAYIQFVRIAGREIGNPISDSKEIRGPLPRLLNTLDELLKINIRAPIDFTSADREIRRPDYPLVALQQIARNAVMHRSYHGTNAPIRITWFANRVEIQNPGGPFGRVTRENFGRPGASDYRNSYLAEAMKHLGYVQRFGFGIIQARQEMEKNGNPPPEFQVEESYVGVILRQRA